MFYRDWSYQLDLHACVSLGDEADGRPQISDSALDVI